MTDWIIHLMEQYGYFGVFLLICVENIFPPIPSEVILTFGGFMTNYTNLTVTGVVIAATVGSVIGAILLYGIGRILDVDRLEKLVERYGKFLRLKKEDIHRADNWFHRYGYWTVFLCRMVPIVRSLISIPAGMARMNFATFLFFTTLGTLNWNVILVALGAKVGDSWQDIVHYIDIYSNFVYIFLGIFGIIVVVYFFRRGKTS